MPEWTKSQKDAIETRGCDLLVSAAAGSGKTTALTERIVRSVAGGGDIARILVVTFSRASAADMRKKISSELRRRAAEDPGDVRLMRQLSRLGEAQIGTIHSFCSTLVRRYFAELGISPQVRILEESETKLLRAECMTDTIDHFYGADSGEGGDPASDIVALSDHIAGSRDDETMEKTLLSLYEKTSCMPGRFYDIADSASELLEAGARGFLDSSFGSHIKKRVSDDFDYYINVMAAGLEAIGRYDAYADKYRAGFESSYEALLRVKRALDDGDYGAVEAALGSYAPAKLGSVKGEKPEEIKFYFDHRGKLRDVFKNTKKEFFGVSEDVLERSIRRTAAVCRGIVRVLEEFDRRYSAEKRRRGAVDYDDLEHMAGELLSREDIAAAVAGDYDEIYIDEYQDVNGTQDGIFSAISRGNRFMVGDVKQAIYGFRGSDPTLFDAYREKLTTVYMSDNFRCNKPIIDFTNAVCGQLLKFGTVSYGEDDALRHGKGETCEPEPVTVLLTEKESEAEAVADLVEAAVADGYAPSDIAILLRSAKSRAEIFFDALSKRGIAAENSARDNFFESPEVLLTLCLLHVCDNPLYDIYTAGALRSPVFGFDIDMLTRLKSGDNRPLFRVLRDAAEGTITLDDALAEKCRDAYGTITRWREAVRLMTADEVVRMIYRESGIEVLLWSEKNTGDRKDAELRAQNLEALYEYARGCESGGFYGLHRFLSYIDSIIEGGMKEPTPAGVGDDTVKIMTVHKSKGLEFPVVILAGCGSGRNEKDASAGVLWDSGAGAAMKLRADDAGESTVMVDTLPRRGVSEAVLQKLASEEMRVLYVALTRARERLCITAGVNEPEKYIADARREAEFFSAHTVSSEKSYIGWILTALFASKMTGFYQIKTVLPEEKADSAEVPETEAADMEPEEDTAERRRRTDEYRAFIRERLSYRYPFERLGALPAKLSVSRLEPGILDEDATELVAAPAGEPNESALAGTATHIYMQFCDFSLAEQNARAEGERLHSLGYMTKEDYDRIRFDEVENFFRSEIYGRIKAADQVWREQRFNVRLPARDFTESEEDRALYVGEELLVQGVIDCFFRDADGGITLLDYKTDRLTEYERRHPAAAREKLVSRHSQQLSYYRAALERIFGEAPKHTYVYSMHMGREIEI